MNSQDSVLTRILKLELKLDNTIERLNVLIKELTDRYDGNDRTPSILSRIIQLEDFVKSVRWSLGVLYTALIGVILTMLARRL